MMLSGRRSLVEQKYRIDTDFAQVDPDTVSMADALTYVGFYADRLRSRRLYLNLNRQCEQLELLLTHVLSRVQVSDRQYFPGARSRGVNVLLTAHNPACVLSAVNCLKVVGNRYNLVPLRALHEEVARDGNKVDLACSLVEAIASVESYESGGSARWSLVRPSDAEEDLLRSASIVVDQPLGIDLLRPPGSDLTGASGAEDGSESDVRPIEQTET